VRVNSKKAGRVTAPVDPFTLAATGANVESPRRKVVLFAVPLPSLAAATVPLLMFPALVVSVVADAARPLTCELLIVAAVVRTPPVVVTTICPLVAPMAPALVRLP
jgi:hypothetical protein